MRASRATAIVVFGVFAAGVACVSEPPITPTCTLSIAPPAREFSADGGSQALSVTASAPNCDWSATASAPWVVLSAPAAGAGSGAVSYSVAPNSTPTSRTALVAVGSETHSIVQAGATPGVCTYVVDPVAVTLPSTAATGRVLLTTAATCAWNAIAGDPWLIVASASSGEGSATVEFRAEANRREYSRTGAITIGGQRVEVTQAGEEQPAACDYSVAPVDISPCMASGTIVVRVTTGERCSWTVSSDAPWLTVLSGVSGTGSNDIRAEFSSNYEAPRLGRLLVRWPTETAGQNVRVQQAGCRYAVSRSRIDIVAAGGNATFDVLQQSDPTICGGATQDRCVWSAVPDVDWIEISGSMPRTGDNPVSFTVRANPSSQPRTSRITVRDQQVTVVQAGQ